jgi:gluconate 5-dehydrogenase
LPLGANTAIGDLNTINEEEAMHVKDMFALDGKTAVVTGGSVGLGAQMATALAEAGANVVVAARKVDRCIEMCAKLEKNGIRGLAVGCDVSKTEDCQNLVDVTIKEFGALNILVNNAGISWIAKSLNFPMDKWQRVMNLNVNGTFQLSVMAAKIMKEQGGGKIVNMASIGGLRGDLPEIIDSVAYTASKGAILTMTKDLAVKWARYGITVNAICPGWFPTSMNTQHLEVLADKLIPRIPLGRYGGSEDIKGLIVFLSSAASDYITGQYVVVDGGQTALV